MLKWNLTNSGIVALLNNHQTNQSLTRTIIHNFCYLLMGSPYFPWSNGFRKSPLTVKPLQVENFCPLEVTSL